MPPFLPSFQLLLGLGWIGSCRKSFSGEDYAEPYKRQVQFLHMN